MEAMRTGGHRGQPLGGPYWDGVFAEWEPSVAHALWRAHSDAINARLVERWLPAGQGTVLKTDLFDEAVGDGLYPVLRSRAETVVGIDVSDAVVDAAGRRYPELAARAGNVLDLPFADGSFDAVVSNSTLDHFSSHRTLAAGVRELARVLRPGGHLVLTLDNRMNPIVAVRTSFLFGVLYRIGAVPYFVGATHGPRAMARVLRASGFELIDRTAIMHCPPQLAAVLAARLSAPSPARHLRRALAFEALERLPSAPLTGHFVAALAIRSG